MEPTTSRKRMNRTADQLKTRLSQQPLEVKLNFFRKSDEAFEQESQDYLKALSSFQADFVQITNVFDATKTSETKEEIATSKFQDMARIVQNLAGKMNVVSRIVNPEIGQKVQEAETNAVSKYLEQLEFHKRLAEQNASLKTYARPATAQAQPSSAVKRKPLEIQEMKLSDDDDYENDAEMVSGDFNVIKNELMSKLKTHDATMVGERERFNVHLRNRRTAAQNAKVVNAETDANQLLAKRDEVHHHLDKAKADMEKKLQSRIDHVKQVGATKSQNEDINDTIGPSTVAELVNFEENAGI